MSAGSSYVSYIDGFEVSPDKSKNSYVPYLKKCDVIKMKTEEENSEQ
jgi:hypothetical protein